MSGKKASKRMAYSELCHTYDITAGQRLDVHVPSIANFMFFLPLSSHCTGEPKASR